MKEVVVIPAQAAYWEKLLRGRKIYSLVLPADSFAYMVVFAMSQPEDLDVNERDC